MSAKLFIGNLDYSVTTDELRDYFSSIGSILDCVVVMDRYTGRSRGFGFVEFEDESQANEAVEKLNDTDLKGRKIRVSIAKPSERSGENGGGSSSDEAPAETSDESESEAEVEADDAEEATESTEETEESEDSKG